MPDHPATDNRGQIHLLGETVAVLLIGQEIDGQRQPTPGQHGHQTLVAERTDQAIERHRGDMVEHRTQLQTQSAMRRQQGIAGHLRAHLAIAQDEMREDREHRFARRTLDTPDGDPTQTDTDVMRVARQAPAAATGRLVFELKAEGQDEGEDTFEKRLAIAKQLKVGRFVLKIDGDGAVFARRLAAVPMCHPQVIRSRQLMRHDGGNTLKSQDHREGLRTLPLNPMECGLFYPFGMPSRICSGDNHLILPGCVSGWLNRRVTALGYSLC